MQVRKRQGSHLVSRLFLVHQYGKPVSLRIRFALLVPRLLLRMRSNLLRECHYLPPPQFHPFWHQSKQAVQTRLCYYLVCDEA